MANPVLACPYVHSTLVFKNEHIGLKGVSIEEAGKLRVRQGLLALLSNRWM
jgi:hypothetical protein